MNIQFFTALFLIFVYGATFSQETQDSTDQSNPIMSNDASLEVEAAEEVETGIAPELESPKEVQGEVKADLSEEKSTEVAMSSATLSRLKPMKSDWGFGFNITGLINNIELEGYKDIIGNDLLFFRHYLKDDLALRLGIGIQRDNNSVVRKDSLNGAYVEFDSTYTRFDFSLSGGVEKHLGNMRRLDPYLGAQFMLIFKGKENYDWNEVRRESQTVSTSITNEKTVEGGINGGLSGIIGFNYFLAKNMSIGAEYIFGYYYSKTGGNYSEFRTETPSSGSSTSTKKEGALETSSTGFQINSKANIAFSIFF